MMNERATKRANSTRKYSRNSENVIEMLLISDIIKHIKLFKIHIVVFKYQLDDEFSSYQKPFGDMGT